jgi:hypothetical protein
MHAFQSLGTCHDNAEQDAGAVAIAAGWRATAPAILEKGTPPMKPQSVADCRRINSLARKRVNGGFRFIKAKMERR